MTICCDRASPLLTASNGRTRSSPGMHPASGQNLPNVVTFHTDATIYRCALDAGRSVTFDRTEGRRIFVYLGSGQLTVNGVQLGENDQARIDIEEPLALDSRSGADFILIDVPSCKGWGYGAETLRGDKKKK